MSNLTWTVGTLEHKSIKQSRWSTHSNVTLFRFLFHPSEQGARKACQPCSYENTSSCYVNKKPTIKLTSRFFIWFCSFWLRIRFSTLANFLYLLLQLGFWKIYKGMKNNCLFMEAFDNNTKLCLCYGANILTYSFLFVAELLVCFSTISLLCFLRCSSVASAFARQQTIPAIYWWRWWKGAELRQRNINMNLWRMMLA